MGVPDEDGHIGVIIIGESQMSQTMREHLQHLIAIDKCEGVVVLVDTPENYRTDNLKAIIKEYIPVLAAPCEPLPVKEKLVHSWYRRKKR